MFRLILTEKTNGPKTGRVQEILGSYNPHANEINFEADRIKHWISNGAQVSDTVHNLLVSKKIIEGKKKNVLPKGTPIVKEASEEEAPKEEEKAKEEAPAKEESESPKEEEKKEEPKQEEVVEEATESKEEAPTEEEKKAE